MGSVPDRPVNVHWPIHGPGGGAHIEPTSQGPQPDPAHQFQEDGPGPIRRIKFSEDGSRTGPTHGKFRDWPAARPSLSHFHFFRSGPARFITFSKGSTRPGLVRRKCRIGPVRPGLWQAFVSNNLGHAISIPITTDRVVIKPYRHHKVKAAFDTTGSVAMVR